MSQAAPSLPDPGQPKASYDGGMVECCSHHEMEVDRYILLYLAGGLLVLTSFVAGFAGIGSA
ncbi:MAG: hypothetical protein AAFU70_07910, partial [Planctomycetota bacterium]